MLKYLEYCWPVNIDANRAIPEPFILFWKGRRKKGRKSLLENRLSQKSEYMNEIRVGLCPIVNTYLFQVLWEGQNYQAEVQWRWTKYHNISGWYHHWIAWKLNALLWFFFPTYKYLLKTLQTHRDVIPVFLNLLTMSFSTGSMIAQSIESYCKKTRLRWEQLRAIISSKFISK